MRYPRYLKRACLGIPLLTAVPPVASTAPTIQQPLRFACLPIHPQFNQQPFYDYYLGAPKGAAVVGKDGLMTRAFDGATVTLSTTSFQSSRGNLNSGCVQWASGETTGVCPTTV